MNGSVESLGEPARILVVDDEQLVTLSVSQWLERQGHACVTAKSGLDALEKLSSSQFDVVVTDIRMPDITGIELVQAAKGQDPDLQVIVMTGTPTIDFAAEAIRSSADDFLVKPFDLEQLSHSVKRALEHRRLLLENRAYRMRLEEKVRSQAERIERLFLDGLMALAGAIEARDKYTRGHLDRVTGYALSTGREKRLNREQMWRLWLGSLFHDVGKMAIPDAILNKEGPLTEEEYGQMKKHPELGAAIVERVLFLRPAALPILQHQERYDGSGYPAGLKGEKISIEGRILAVCDAFDAMSSDRPYRKGQPKDVAMRQLERYAGSQFDPSVVDAFRQAREKGITLEIPISPFLTEVHARL